MGGSKKAAPQSPNQKGFALKGGAILIPTRFGLKRGGTTKTTKIRIKHLRIGGWVITAKKNGFFKREPAVASMESLYSGMDASTSLRCALDVF